MFECDYKFELEDSIACAKYVYKSQKRTQDKIIAVLVPILIVIMVALLVVDIIKNRNFVWDIILLVALLVLESLYLMIPFWLVRSQKKSYKSQHLDEMDHLHIELTDNILTETMFKNGEEAAKNVHNLKSLTSYIEDATRLVLVFNKVEFVCIKKANLKGDINQLKKCLNKAMAKVKK